MANITTIGFDKLTLLESINEIYELGIKRVSNCKQLSLSIIDSNDLLKITQFRDQCKIAAGEMLEKRKPLTSKLDEIKKMFTSLENEILEQSKRAELKLIEIKTKIAKDEQKRKEIETYEIRLLNYIDDFTKNFISSMYHEVKKFNPDNIDKRKEDLKNVKFTYPRSHFDQFKHIDGIDLDAKYYELNELYKAEIEKTKNDILNFIPKIESTIFEEKKIDQIKMSLEAGEKFVDAKKKYKIKLLNHAGVVDVFVFWMENYGKNEQHETLGTWSIDRIKAYVENQAAKGTFIDSPESLKYEEYYK